MQFKPNQLTQDQFTRLKEYVSRDLGFVSELSPTNPYEIWRVQLITGVGIAYRNDRNPTIKVSGTLLEYWNDFKERT